MFLIVGLSFANNTPLKNFNDPQIGDVIIINQTNANGYKYIFFPKLNFIVKKGGIGNYNLVEHTHAIIKKVEKNENGDIFVILKRKNDKKFFGSVKSVKANYTKALNAGEISKTTN
jgi:hypothetical protein